MIKGDHSLKNRQNQHKALLFVNGETPNPLPTHLDEYHYIACTDGAYHRYLLNSLITPHFIIGDLDSIDSSHVLPCDIQMIHTPNQNKTDFEKALLFLADNGITQFDIYGATGRASDHFLGNLSVAMQYYKQYQLHFYDNYCHFFFAKPQQTLKNVKNKVISLIPLSTVSGLSLSGFKYPLDNETLTFGGLTSLRNQALLNDVTLSFTAGDLLVLIEK